MRKPLERYWLLTSESAGLPTSGLSKAWLPRHKPTGRITNHLVGLQVALEAANDPIYSVGRNLSVSRWRCQGHSFVAELKMMDNHRNIFARIHFFKPSKGEKEPDKAI